MSCFLRWIPRSFIVSTIAMCLSVGSEQEAVAQALPSGVRAVNHAATGANTGLSWTNAYTKLQDAIADSNATEIWIAGGVYRPDQGGGNSPNDPDASFVLRKDLSIIGNFAGTEASLSQRTMNSAYQTLLSGDIGTANVNTDNSHQVVKVSHTGTPVMTPANTLLDGVTIAYGMSDWGENDGGAGVLCDTGGNARFNNCIIAHNRTATSPGFPFPNGSAYGGGVRINDASPVFINCLIRDNQTGDGSAYGGGVVIRNDSDPQFIDCTFRSNASGHGGGLAVKNGANVQLTSCLFEGNTILTSGSGSEPYGGGVSVDRSGSAQIVNCTFAFNTAERGGAYAQYGNSSSFNSTIDNCIFWGNTATNSGNQIGS